MTTSHDSAFDSNATTQRHFVMVIYENGFASAGTRSILEADEAHSKLVGETLTTLPSYRRQQLSKNADEVANTIRGRQAEDVWYSSEASFPENVKDRVRALLPPLELSLEMIPTLKTVFVSDGPLSAKLGVGFPFELQLFFDGEKQRLRKTRDTNQDRKLLFWALEHGLGKLGLDGRACVLRAVCEAADHPFREAGLFGEVLHVLLQIPESGYNGTTLKAYYEAGKACFGCQAGYGCCRGTLVLRPPPWRRRLLGLQGYSCSAHKAMWRVCVRIQRCQLSARAPTAAQGRSWEPRSTSWTQIPPADILERRAALAAATFVVACAPRVPTLHASHRDGNGNKESGGVEKWSAEIKRVGRFGRFS
ncbi:hypothetical protein IscW_ISCW012414 [Ixodes scapularis]|uniref:Uncharacterized protein n=1 Tax=Ixodes scapularis TaxID=6945 RepID=B7QFS1_IXOSC|nr:hypothetical protein IscW_ISCW012414 [Ixodes scapularis]|eukprot:XP_002414385.1 hypothetical protein IscW_ISCW012414 [Ixodes scapularis]